MLSAAFKKIHKTGHRKFYYIISASQRSFLYAITANYKHQFRVTAHGILRGSCSYLTGLSLSLKKKNNNTKGVYIIIGLEPTVFTHMANQLFLLVGLEGNPLDSQ